MNIHISEILVSINFQLFGFELNEFRLVEADLYFHESKTLRKSRSLRCSIRFLINNYRYPFPVTMIDHYTLIEITSSPGFFAEATDKTVPGGLYANDRTSTASFRESERSGAALSDSLHARFPSRADSRAQITRAITSPICPAESASHVQLSHYMRAFSRAFSLKRDNERDET